MAERFSEWLEAINYSPKTRVNYTRDVKVFLDWLADNTAINSLVDVTPAHLIAGIITEKGLIQPVTAASIRALIGNRPI